MLRVGLTGGIGCGKSVVATSFAALGVPLIDTDVIAHQLTAIDGGALPAICASMGHIVLQSDGTLDRAAVRRRIFADAGERKKLEAILHPMILQAVQQQLQTLANVAYVVIVIPLLLETKIYRNLIDRVLVVDCLEAQQIARVMARSDISLTETKAIMAAQVNRPARLADADDVLVNTGDIVLLHPQIASLHQKYLDMSLKQL